MDIYISDNHLHVNPVRGLGAEEIARRFRKEGGRFAVIVSLLTWCLDLPPCELDSYEKTYRMTIESCKIFTREGVKSICMLGIHPAEIQKMIEKGWNIDKILNFVESCLKIIEKYIKNGEAHGIGEIGRPHWNVSERDLRIHEEVIKICLQYAKDLNIPVHLHLDRNGMKTLEFIHNIVRDIGNRDYSVVLHHAEAIIIEEAWNRKLVPSIPVGRKQDFEIAIRSKPLYVPESDYLDDPKRPGAVIPPWSLAKRLSKLDKDTLRRICIDNMKLIYGDHVPEI